MNELAQLPLIISVIAILVILIKILNARKQDDTDKALISHKVNSVIKYIRNENKLNSEREDLYQKREREYLERKSHIEPVDYPKDIGLDDTAEDYVKPSLQSVKEQNEEDSD